MPLPRLPRASPSTGPRIQAHAYNNGMMIQWKEGGWTYTAVGANPQVGLILAKGLLSDLGRTPAAIPGTKGELRVSELGNPTYTDASWTRDGRHWLTLTGRSTARQTLAELRSMVKVGRGAAR